MEKITLTEKTLEAFNYVRDNGGRVSTAELAAGLGCAVNSITGRVNSMVKKELATREYEVVAGEDGKEKKICYVVLTDAGKEFVQDAE